ncbi:hypothetical protein AlmWB_01940 [Candidatus Phytoplasma phoenicium]|uniref:Uncharacterized protein n=1 Tax=Candidatus Phytoplasma phoenicium TaxID=198422 RepID=A0A0L0MKU7_9MOLU|nr:hypothetical protein AlmWB_01940 [Candidatus Phytoplasma phoenicium]
MKSQKNPSNLASYIKDRHPFFDRWNKRGLIYDCTILDGFDSASFDKKDDSQLYLYVKFEKNNIKAR